MGARGSKGRACQADDREQRRRPRPTQARRRRPDARAGCHRERGQERHHVADAERVPLEEGVPGERGRRGQREHDEQRPRDGLRQRPTTRRTAAPATPNSRTAVPVRTCAPHHTEPDGLEGAPEIGVVRDEEAAGHEPGADGQSALDEEPEHGRGPGRRREPPRGGRSRGGHRPRRQSAMPASAEGRRGDGPGLVPGQAGRHDGGTGRTPPVRRRDRPPTRPPANRERS